MLPWSIVVSHARRNYAAIVLICVLRDQREIARKICKIDCPVWLKTVALFGLDTHHDSVPGFETERAIECLRRAILARHLQLDRPDSLRTAKLADRRDHLRTESPSSVAWRDEEIGEHPFAPAEFQIVIVGQDQISGERASSIDHPNAAERFVLQQFSERPPGGSFVI